VPGADHLAEGAAATAYVRPHDVRIAEEGSTDPLARAKATVVRITSLGWLSRVNLRLSDGQVIVAHIPQQELFGAKEQDEVWLDLRNPKAFLRAAPGESPVAASDPEPEPVNH
jgi:ABC-type Fe3+/spermidine/putrescine transport system ATPase subunit